ncbi:glutathione S-transferase family protein [Gloeobacter kilaueensis]|uniref:Glutathione S-transferase n=1 Tax=Gloeobacter kilaueensis (strain ATCC BAA-2537 / CCAP 1431/1 / ULC 316 / JS1) TaxID=1183438 RepID=U5QH10_GLOK1|nr:glutathione S-transferase family protein [Gloeobacter kilaueensis]AGY56894.1 glutathione S-transferase [Gloeobacter kilaueensis JS1]
MPKALPSKFLIAAVRFTWTALWHTMMARLAPRDRAGAYVRPESQFRHQISDAPDNPYQPQAGRYRLIVGMGCPWAHRTLVVRAIKGLEAAIPVVVVVPDPLEGGWVFERAHEGCRSLAEFYRLSQAGYTGRSTVPVLWDSQTRTIVNNESAEIIVLLDAAFERFAARPGQNLYPEGLKAQIDEWNSRIYAAINDGVYRTGFAQSQSAYEQAVNRLFAALDDIDAALETRRYLCGEKLSLADVRLFTTLIRFDLVYHGLFKCNRRRVRDYAHLWGYLRDLYQLPGIADTCDFDTIRCDYYGNLFPLNPGGIIPPGPDLQELSTPHDRERLGSAEAHTGG